MEQPQVRIIKGSPTEAEGRAVEHAFAALMREQAALRARSAEPDPWRMAGRAEALRIGGEALRGRSAVAWRLSGRLNVPAPTNLQPGRGDAR